MASAHRWHRRLGLSFGAWIAVLGLTGLLLDHREDWKWLWQSALPSDLVPQSVARQDAGRRWPLYRQDEGSEWLAGPGGLYVRRPRGEWNPVPFAGREDMPWVRAWLAEDDALLLATDDGLWRATLSGASPVALPGTRLTGLSRDPSGRLWVVEARSRLWKREPSSGRFHPVSLPAPLSESLASSLSLSRLVRDLHYGRGIVSAPFSLWINDLAAVAMVMLPATGLLYWWLPRLFRARRLAGRPVAGPLRSRLMRQLFRIHAPIAGLVLLLPSLWLLPTGVVLDHASGLRAVLSRLEIPRPWLPPVYGLDHWQGEIRAIAFEPGSGALLIATRQGLFRRDGQGAPYRVASAGRHFLLGFEEAGGCLFALGMGGPNLRHCANGDWMPFARGVHMPRSVSAGAQGHLLLRNHKGLFEVDAEGQVLRSLPHSVPEDESVSWHAVLRALHDGLLIHPRWKWFNDATAVALALLLMTGLWRLLRRGLW